MAYVKLEDLVRHMGLEPVYCPEGVQSRIYTPEIVRPGLQMAGYFDWFSLKEYKLWEKRKCFSSGL